MTTTTPNRTFGTIRIGELVDGDRVVSRQRALGLVQLDFESGATMTGDRNKWIEGAA